MKAPINKLLKEINYRQVMALDETALHIHRIMVKKGFWSDRVKEPYSSAVKIALMQTELSEAIQELRKGNMAGVEEELADTIIRILDYCGAKKLKIGTAIVLKLKREAKRPYKHKRRF